MSEYEPHRHYPPRRARRHVAGSGHGEGGDQPGRDLTDYRLQGFAERGQVTPGADGYAVPDEPLAAGYQGQEDRVGADRGNGGYPGPQGQQAGLASYRRDEWGYQGQERPADGRQAQASYGDAQAGYAQGGAGYAQPGGDYAGYAEGQPGYPGGQADYAPGEADYDGRSARYAPAQQGYAGGGYAAGPARAGSAQGYPQAASAEGQGGYDAQAAAEIPYGHEVGTGATDATADAYMQEPEGAHPGAADNAYAQEVGGAAPETAAAYARRPRQAAPAPQVRGEAGDYALDPPANGQHGHHARRAHAHAGRGARPKRRGRRIAVISLVVIVLVVIAVVAVQALGGFSALFGGGPDYKGRGTGHVTVTIPKGATGRQIGRILHDKDVVASAGAFEQAFKSNSLSQGVQPGTYKLRRKMSSAQALALLLDPASRSDLVITIPDGFTLTQVKKRLENVGGFSVAKVEDACRDTAALGLPAAANGNLEGWLAADSYAIDVKQDPRAVLKKMVSLQIKRLDQAGVPLEMRQQVLTKASILEREVNLKKYYPQVARVMENRLHDNPETHGLLQMDSTVLYGVGKSGGIPSKDDLKRDTPYNTYMHKGLPPGPIGVPSLAAVQAVMHPAAGNWLYFTTVNLKTGETKFALSLAEHQQNLAQLRGYCKANPGVC